MTHADEEFWKLADEVARPNRKYIEPYYRGVFTTMDALQLELAKLRRDANLTQSIEDVDRIIAQLEKARESIVSGT